MLPRTSRVRRWTSLIHGTSPPAYLHGGTSLMRNSVQGYFTDKKQIQYEYAQSAARDIGHARHVSARVPTLSGYLRYRYLTHEKTHPPRTLQEDCA